jgi:hypothetical protein
MAFSPSSRARLTSYDLDRFGDGTLFHRVARAVCRAGCLPRKELYEAWEVARRVRRLFRGGRVVDVAGGHGLLAHLLLVLDDSSPLAVVVDPQTPPSSEALGRELVSEWPRLAGRVAFVASPLEEVTIAAEDLVVSNHACGALTDRVLDRAVRAGARVAVVPCCHDFDTCDAGGVGGWVDRALAIDLTRAARLRAIGYQIWTQTIPEEITPKNRLLMARLS